jgi:hypothetical protein
MVCALAVAMAAGMVCAEDDAAGPTIAIHKSRHFRLHTDVSDGRAAEALAQMEAALARAAAYWGRTTRGRIECYLAENVTIWPEAALPHPLARVWIGGIGGATIRNATHHGQTAAKDVTIYASTLPRIIEHEVIHAYCCQAFGATGPDWYKEGMAQVLAYPLEGEVGVCCPPEVLDTIQKGPARGIGQIVGGGAFTGPTSKSLDELLTDRDDPSRPLLMADWTRADTEDLSTLKEPYCWSWAVCHFLANNPNYAGRFRRLGEHFLLSGSDTRDASLGSVSSQADFEFSEFVRSACQGYPTRLCAWEWDKQFEPLAAGTTVGRRIQAARGYQASGLAVRAGERIEYRTEGKWTAVPAAGPTDANGTAEGAGRLIAAVLDGYQLSEPFELGAQGQFTVPANGNLYVRCAEPWHAVADNSGSLTVRFTSAGQ